MNNRVRIRIWVSLIPKLQAEVDRTGLNTSEFVNLVLAEYLKMLPKRN